ncbi:hypothetical protein A0O30_04375 [Pseudomonas sp. LLC-1]|jgi:hypothetical protein|uniref:tail fiber domain-containing protein n=1 Tax=Pseudomonas TaxID=286 RepID=UPI000D01D243|nr:tail fiber domain-containing protein [Pseudomonas sp. LLC-1]MDR2318033.1 tail fiber domain-containing protein [Pseudomonas sp.]PRN06300.1 hypothetical protein A0O30_04375 [Pseudomonas sp. LLC-1]
MKFKNAVSRIALVLASVAASGAVLASGDVGQPCCPFSDARLKTSPEVLQGATEQLLRLQGVTFTWKETGRKDIGLMAQDVQAVYPELVHQKSEMLTVDYQKLVAPLIESIRELNQRIDVLEKSQAKAL